MKLTVWLEEECSNLRRYQIIEQCQHSRSQMYEWMRSVEDRKSRGRKEMDPHTVIQAAKVIVCYPHMGGQKGQAYMIYHRLGLIAQKVYDEVKKVVKVLVFQEVSHRRLLPECASYEHEIPQRVNEVWAEDFTRVTVCGESFFVSLVIDVRSRYYLGDHADGWAGNALVAEPFRQALAINEGKGPQWFLLSDNGKPYIAQNHEQLLRAYKIVHKLIPATKPQFNGSMECGIKEFKNVFYALWARKEKEADKEKTLLERVRLVVRETSIIMNTVLPRQCLQGVTPQDIYTGCHGEKIEANRRYVEEQKARKDFPPWEKGFWQTIKDAIGLEEMDNHELMTTFFFFGRRPLRQITKFAGQAVG